MLKNVRSLVLVLGVVSSVCACGSGGTTEATGGTGGTGGTGATGGTGGTGATGGACVATGTPITTLDQACAHNCCLASGLSGCSTTEAVCEQSCMTTFDNTSAVNADLGNQYKKMMICVATDPYFATPAQFVCAKPNSPLNLWSPLIDASTDSPCKQEICDWNCDDATHGDMDPWVDLLCACSSV
jgi:hypothetical protein